MDAATTVLLQRYRTPPGLSRMISVSLAVHVVLLVAVALLPDPGASRTRQSGPVMTISLGGAPGPRAGGMNQLGGRPIQTVRPIDAPKIPEPVRPPAAKPPEMTAPVPDRRSRPPARPAEKPPVRNAPSEARGRTPTRGAEVQAGDAVAETGSRGMGFGGLSSGGGGGTGGYLDVGDFCCPEYLATMLQLIRRNWDNRSPMPGKALVKFTVQRDGTIAGVELERSSGYAALDFAAQRSLQITRRLPPLPAAFDQPQLTVHLNFEYQR